MIWHSAKAEQVLDFFKVDANDGLPQDTADAILLQTQTEDNSKLRFWSFFKKQLNKPFFIVMLAAAAFLAVVSLSTPAKLWISGLVIAVITLLDVLWNSWQEFRSQGILEQLADKTIRNALVIRGGQEMLVPVNRLVRGDIIILKEGDCIPCDARLIEAVNFRCDEYALTGETVDVKKEADATFEDITEIALRSNMVFAECTVMHGYAKAIVTDTGDDTEIERLRTISNIQTKQDFTYEKSAAAITKYSLAIITAIVALTFLLVIIFNLNRTEQSFLSLLSQTFADCTALLLAALPETLSAAVAIIIGFSLKILDSKGVLINNPASLEKLSNVSVICADKTGVFTTDKMTVKKVYDTETTLDLSETVPTKSAMLLLKLGMICGNGIEYEDSASRLTKDSTDLALSDVCQKYDGVGSEEAINMYPTLAQLPFDAQKRLITSVNMVGGKCFVITKGAPESLLPLCPSANTDEINKNTEKLANDALRVIAVGYKLIDTPPAVPSSAELECNLTFAGLIGFEDQPSAQAVDTVLDCKKSGIRTIMITGDHILTAKALARRIGILPDNMNAITGEEIATMSDEELDRQIGSYSVFARITPNERYRIVRALQHNNEVVAITGGTVDDAPILRKADIGIAFGDSATPVAKNTCDVIIENYDFKAVAGLIKTAKNIFINIKKVIHYLLGCNIGELLALFTGTLIFGAPILAASQILLLNLLTDAVPCITLGLSPAPEKMPRGKSNLFSIESVIRIAINSVCLCIVTLIAFGIGSKFDCGQTAAFAVLCISQVLHLISSYSEDLLVSSNILKAKRLFAVAGISLVVILAIVLTPARAVLGFVNIAHLLPTILLLAVILFICNELTKLGIWIYKINKK